MTQPASRRLVTEAALAVALQGVGGGTPSGPIPLSAVAVGAMLQCPLDGTVSTNASLARPSARTDVFFTWNSTVQPTNMLPGDKWEQPA